MNLFTCNQDTDYSVPPRACILFCLYNHPFARHFRKGLESKLGFMRFMSSPIQENLFKLKKKTLRAGMKYALRNAKEIQLCSLIFFLLYQYFYFPHLYLGLICIYFLHSCVEVTNDIEFVQLDIFWLT